MADNLNKLRILSIIDKYFIQFIFFILLCFVFCYVLITHEPWFDEAQSWQIARCASYRDILFLIPHFEGHPPFWHLLLSIFAKNNISFEFGLKSIGLIITMSSAYLLIFKSNLPIILRLAIPFTYFFFYQYGVIVRPYGLMLLIMILIGMQLGKRKEHPWKLSLLLCLLCLTSAYGILIAGGIAICIVWEIFEEKGRKKFFSSLFIDNEIRSLFPLLFLAILLAFEISPNKDAYAFAIKGHTPLYLRLLCTFFTFPVECFISTSSWFGKEQVSMQVTDLPVAELLIFVLIGCFLLFILFMVSTRKGLKYFLVPYSFFCFFSAAVYSSTHHLGIVFIIVLFWLEYVSREKSRFYYGNRFLHSKYFTEKDQALLKLAYKSIVAVCLLVPLYWNLSSSILEVKKDYNFARRMAYFIKNNHLDNYFIMGRWTEKGSNHIDSGGHDDYVNTFIVSDGVLLDSYFNRNIIANFNDGNESDMYLHHKKMSYEESRKRIKKWRMKGLPDVIIGIPDLSTIYGDDFSYDDYTCVYRNESGFIWKGKFAGETNLLYLKNDIFQNTQLEQVDDSDMRMRYIGLRVTDEIKNEYNNGTPIEEILDPYLDQMFGKK